jgi:hypothetical protein
MGNDRAEAGGLTAAQAMDLWLWLWLGFAEREAALGKRSAVPGSAEIAAELSSELATLETISGRLSAELPVPGPDAREGRTFSRLQGGLEAGAVARLTAWLAEPTAQPAARIRRRAAEVLAQARQAPPPSPARLAAVELWAWLTGAEADRRILLAAADGDRRAARQMSDELRLLQTVQDGVRRGQPDVIPSHQHEAHWLGARQPLQAAIAADLARLLRKAEPEVTVGRGGPRLASLVTAAASRLEALAGPGALATVLAREAAEGSATSVRAKIAAGLIAAEAGEPRHATSRFLGRTVVADATRLGATLVDADLGDEVAWRAVVTPRDFDEAAEFSAGGAIAYELYLLVGADGTLRAVHQRIDRSPHGRRWFAPVPPPRWLHPQGRTLDVAWSDLAEPARARMLALLAALTSGATPTLTSAPLPDRSMALVARRTRRSRH